MSPIDKKSYLIYWMTLKYKYFRLNIEEIGKEFTLLTL